MTDVKTQALVYKALTATITDPRAAVRGPTKDTYDTIT